MFKFSIFSVIAREFYVSVKIEQLQNYYRSFNYEHKDIYKMMMFCLKVTPPPFRKPLKRAILLLLTFYCIN